MFWIDEKAYDGIISVISKYCCGCSGAFCSEADCDIHIICEILNRHVLKRQAEEEDEKLPFRDR